MILIENILGISTSHISFDVNEHIARPIHKDIIAPFLRLQADAKQAGFDLQLVSGFRDFDRQLSIWTAKSAGQRVLLDHNSEPLNFEQLSPSELLNAILRWSALPGASRHHWGTDVDVFDASAVAGDYDVQLTTNEVEGNGPFRALHDWLDTRINASTAHGFFRPYAQDTGGIAPERWHLSYAPLAYEFQQGLTKNALLESWTQAELPLLPEVEKSLDKIWNKFIWVEDEKYP